MLKALEHCFHNPGYLLRILRDYLKAARCSTRLGKNSAEWRSHRAQLRELSLVWTPATPQMIVYYESTCMMYRIWSNVQMISGRGCCNHGRNSSAHTGNDGTVTQQMDDCAWNVILGKAEVVMLALLQLSLFKLMKLWPWYLSIMIDTRMILFHKVWHHHPFIAGISHTLWQHHPFIDRRGKHHSLSVKK